jgi:transposase
MYLLTGGQEADCKQAIPLFESLDKDALVAVLADKGYDTNEIRTWLQERKLQTVIPPKSNRIEAIDCDFLQYKEQHVIECLFGSLKHYHRVATRYEQKSVKLHRHASIFICIAMGEMKCQHNLEKTKNGVSLHSHRF